MTRDTSSSIPAGRRLAVLADIHANFVALERVEDDLADWGPDQVIVAGDIVNRGPRPVPCLDRVLERRERDDWIVTRGNHEEYVLQCASPPYEPDAPEAPVFRGAHWTYELLTSHHRTSIGELPRSVTLRGPEDTKLIVTHASKSGLVEGIFPWTTPEEIAGLIDPSADLYVVAHTHCPLEVMVEGTRVVNVGSVGLPFDGDQRACYGRFVWSGTHWDVEIARLEYDVEAAERDFHRSGFIREGGPLAPLILDELRSAESRLFQWMERYYTRVVAGEITIKSAVTEFLSTLNDNRTTS